MEVSHLGEMPPPSPRGLEDGASPGKGARGFNFPLDPQRREKQEDLWPAFSSSRFINSIYQVLGTWWLLGNAGEGSKAAFGASSSPLSTYLIS